MLMAGKLTPKDIAKYKEKSRRAINGLNIAIQKASEIAQTPKIGEKWKYIADCMGLKQEEGNSYYNTYIPLNSNVFFLLRNANHNNTIPELYNKREQNGRPNKRFVVFFQRDNKFGDVVSDFLESEHHTITYPPNALDTENDVIAYCKAYITLFQDGSTTFPKLPSIQENKTKTQYNMKQRIRLTEGDLHRIIRNCVNEAYGSPTITDDIANCNLHRYWSPINNRIYDSPFQDTNKMLKKIDDLSYEIESIIRRDLTKYGVEYKHNAYVEKLIELANKMRPLIPYILNSLAQYTGEQPNGADSYHKEHLARKHTPYRNQYQHKFLRK